MWRTFGLFLMIGLGVVGCQRGSPPSGTRPQLEPEKDSNNDSRRDSKGSPMTTASAWTWGYFFAAPSKAAATEPFGEHPTSATLYKVEKFVPVTGKPGVRVDPGSALVRVEAAVRLPVLGPSKSPALLFHGVPQHLEYTSGEQRADLNKRSRTDLPAGKDTVVVIIPIRKSAEWWALPLDERIGHFQQRGDRQGHTAIGAKYADRIYRKLYHTRYAVETREHDFVTYFEFERSRSADFQALLDQLRDPKSNPEWKYVDLEYEIWMTKVE